MEISLVAKFVRKKSTDLNTGFMVNFYFFKAEIKKIIL